MSASDPFIVKHEENRGNFLVASRDISQGETILEEEALMVGPSGEPRIFCICLGCYKIITAEPHLCSKCGWPVCSDACEKAAMHSKFECKIFKSVLLQPTNDPLDYHSITILRCLLLLQANPKKYELLLKTEPEIGKRRTIPPPHVAEFIHKRCDLGNFKSDIVGRMANIVGMNAYSTTDPLSIVARSVPKLAAMLFYHATMMSHDCVPNTSWTRIESPDNTFSIRVWATIPIKNGELITTQYLDITRPQVERRFHLKDMYGFWCACNRCSDATELGTFYGAVKCNKCTDGYLISEEPLEGSDAVWKCGKCNIEVNYRDYVVTIETPVTIQLAMAADEEDFEKILEDNVGKTLHANHWLMIDCRQEIVKRMMMSVPSIKDNEERKERAEVFLKYCKLLNQITMAFYPGHNRIKARMTLYMNYASALTKLEDKELDDELERIEDLIRKGEELKVFG